MIRLDIDMEMPVSCARCPMSHDYMWCSAMVDKRFDDNEFDCIRERPKWCPLKEIDDDEGEMR